MKILETLEKYILLVTIFLIPIVFLPIFPNPFDTTKIALLAAGISLALVVKAVKTVIKGSLEISTGNFDIPVVLVALAYLLSAIPFFLGFLWAGFTSSKRSWHDLLVGTMVVREQ